MRVKRQIIEAVIDTVINVGCLLVAARCAAFALKLIWIMMG